MIDTIQYKNKIYFNIFFCKEHYDCSQTEYETEIESKKSVNAFIIVYTCMYT